MSDFKSKLPDLKELGSITGKLFKDIKTSVTEIVKDYKEKREQSAEETTPAPAKKTAAKKADASAEETPVKKKTQQSAPDNESPVDKE